MRECEYLRLVQHQWSERRRQSFGRVEGDGPIEFDKKTLPGAWGAPSPRASSTSPGSSGFGSSSDGSPCNRKFDRRALEFVRGVISDVQGESVAQMTCLTEELEEEHYKCEALTAALEEKGKEVEDLAAALQRKIDYCITVEKNILANVTTCKELRQKLRESRNLHQVRMNESNTKYAQLQAEMLKKDAESNNKYAQLQAEMVEKEAAHRAALGKVDADFLRYSPSPQHQ